MSNPVFSFSLYNICQQKKKSLYFSKPLPRIDIDFSNSFYNKGYTKDQLDMRRKAEILKYNNNSSSTKTNNLTKAEKWSQLTKGNSNSQLSNYPTITLTTIDYLGNYNTITIKYPNLLNTIPTTKYIIDSNKKMIINKRAYQINGSIGYFYINFIRNGAYSDCVNENSIFTPTSSSDVPGSIINLVNDETIPLYNYKVDVNSYSYDSNTNNKDKWLLNPQKDIILLNGKKTKLFSLLITEFIDKRSYNFSLNIPISIFIIGTNLSPGYLNNPVKFSNLDVSINNLFFDVKYNDKSVIYQSNNPIPKIKLYSSEEINLNYRFNSDNNNISYISDKLDNFTPFIFDISFSNSLPSDYINRRNDNSTFNTVYNSITDEYSNEYSNTNLLESDSYVAQCYIGHLNISNINLRTSPEFIYDFYLEMNLIKNFSSDSESINYSNSIRRTIGPYAIANVSNTNNISNNCILRNTYVPTYPVTDFSFNGV
jgi:hypothetical protein